MVEKTRIIDIHEKSGTFSYVFKRFSNVKQDYNYSDLSLLRKLLSNEKARMLNIIKTDKPKSIYHLAKILGRDFKTVRDDLILLKKFGLIDLISEKNKSGKRISHKPVLTASSINVVIRI